MDGSGLEKNRIYAGVTFELSKGIESEIYYARELSTLPLRWKEVSALGLQLKLRF